MTSTSVFSDGFFLKDITDGYQDNLAAYSLHNSLVNYAKTADDLDSFFRRKKAETNISSTKEADLVGPDYAVDACNAIVQFQHFLELFIKDILFDINPLI